MQGEVSVGIAMLTLTEANGATLVSHFMSRQYDWSGTGDNPLRATRGSAEFQRTNRQLWQNTFLPRLRELAEAP